MHEMDWQRLERLTVDLFYNEPDILSSDDYGTSGQGDHGVDVIARRRFGDGEEVASCKNREALKRNDLKKWSEDFLEHWDSNWSKRNIRRFVLATTAGNTGDRNVQNAVTAERERFGKLGIEYELWGPKQFVHKLRPHRPIAARYLGETWADIVCGPTPTFGLRSGSATAMVSAAVISQLAELQETLSDRVLERADLALNDLRAGRMEAVEQLLRELRSEKIWPNLQTPVQARILRLAASLAIKAGRLGEADALDQEAEAIQRADEPRLAAQIALERDGAESAIAVLGTPKSIAGKQLLAALLLMTADLSRLSKVVAELVEEAPEDPETVRLFAFHELVMGRRGAALAEIKRAEAMAGEWTAIQNAGVVIRNALCLSPATEREWLFFPNPIDQAFVRHDSAAERCLEEALLLLDRLDSAGVAIPDARLWRLAFLANRPNGHVAASQYARLLLEHDPGQPTVVAWSLVRRLDVDLESSLDLLKKAYEAGTELYRVRVLSLGLAMTHDHPEAIKILRTHLDAQPDESRAEAEHWIARLEGGPLGDDAGDSEALPAALRAAQKAGDFSAAADLLPRYFETSPPHPSALMLAQAIADFERWDLLADYVERLIEFETPGAVRIAAFAASRLNDPEGALKIIDEQAWLFGEAMPADLRRLRVDALLRTGEVQAAIREAEAVGAATGQSDDRIFQAEIMVQIGDVRGAVPAVRQALRDQTLDPHHALRWSRIFQEEDRELSRQLWHSAVAAGLDEKLAVAAMDQAFQLGLDDEVGTLMPAVQARASSGAKEIRLAGIDELGKLISEARRAAAETETLFLDGTLPAHLYARGNFGAFLSLYLGQAQTGEGPLMLRLIRHGARPAEIDQGRPWNEWVIHLDVSGLFEASRLGLLDVLERHSTPIRISRALPQLLLMMEQSAHAAQRSRVEAQRLVWRLVGERRVDVVDRPPPGAMRFGIDAFGDEEEPGLGPLIAALGERGILTETQVKEALARNGSQDAREPLNLEGVTGLHLDEWAIESLATLGQLPDLLGGFAVSIHAGLASALDKAVAGAAEEDRLSALAGGLRERVADGIQTGAYRFLPIARSSDDGDQPKDEPNLLVGQLRDLLGADAVDGGVVWIDDRLVSGYAQTNTMPVVGILDVLYQLRREGMLGRAQWRSKIQALRASGAAFVPFSTEEIVEPLLDAQVRNGRLVETEALRIIRRSLAAASRIERHLKLVNNSASSERPNEIEYPRSVMRLLPAALEAVWTRPNLDLHDAHARSDWLWTHVRMTQSNRVIPGDDPHAGQDFLEVIQVAQVLDKAIDIGGLRDERREAREAFLNWAWQRAIRQKAMVDPTFLPRIGDHLATFFASMLNDREPRMRERQCHLTRFLLLTRVERLPKPVRDLVFGSSSMRRFVTTTQSVRIGNRRFSPVRFWKAARTAFLFGKASFRTAAGERVGLRREGGAIVLSGKTEVRIGVDLPELISVPRSALAARLDAFLGKLDLDTEGLEQARTKAVAATEPHSLALVLEEAREKAPASRYEVIADKLAGRRPFDTEILDPPETRHLAVYLGLDDQKEEHIDLSAAFHRIAVRHSPEEGFRRLAALPLSLPPEIVDFDDEALAALVAKARTPMRIIHLAAETRRRNCKSLALGSLVARLVGIVESHGRLYSTLLRWAEKAFHRDADWRSSSRDRQLALVWAHADALLDLVIRSNGAPEPLIDYFHEQAPPLAAPDLLASRGHPPDQSDPATISPAVLLYHGLAEIFRDEEISTSLSQDLERRIESILLRTVGEARAPDLTLILRRSDGPNVLGSFLRRKPAGLLPDSLEPGQVRDFLIDDALTVIESGGKTKVQAWAQLSTFATGGLSDKQAKRFAAVIREVDLWQIAFGQDEPQLIRWRSLLTPMLAIDRDWVLARTAELAAHCRRHFGPGRYVTDAPTNGIAVEALSELVETAALAAGSTPQGEALADFCNFVTGIVTAWPEAAPTLRNMIDNLLAVTPAGRAAPLWNLSLLLRSFA